MASNPFSFLLLLLSLPYVIAQSNANISIGETLIAGNRDAQRLSPSGEFAFGFYKLESGLFLLAIWYNKIPNQTIIWSANGDNLAAQGSKLELDEDRGLVLSSPLDQELWRSQVQFGRISFGLMNNTGNFQLLNQNSEVVWQSFEHPTDTLVPTQIMELNGILSSRRSETSFSKGKFQFRLAEDGNVVLNPINLPTNLSYGPYYTSGTNIDAANSGYRVIFDELGYLYILRRNGTKFNITNLKEVRSVDAYYYRATMNYDGVFTVSHHPKDSSANSQGWTVSKTIPTDNICKYLSNISSGICGFNSICTLQTDLRPKCECLEGYSLVDPTDEHSTCLPNFELSCQEKEDNSQEDLYYIQEVPNINFPLGDYELYKPSTLEECKNFCLKDCQCAVSIFGGDQCWMKKLPLSNGIKDIPEGGSSEGGALVKLMKNNNVSQRIPGMQFPNEKTNTKDQDIIIKVITILLGSSFFFNIILVAAICMAFFFKYHKRFCADKIVNESNLRNFTHKELIEATNNFKNELGRGSCGIVYKGAIEISQMTTVAVKKLDKMLQESDKEFKTEVDVIGQTHHKNLVRLLGYCDEGLHRILVYEFLSNGTLAGFLFGELKPSWNQRIHIAFGVARGLFYLHEECCTRIIHCDIKPQNILLDEYYNVKISDFGLAKLLLINQSHTNTGIRGTKGYVAPDWFRSASITAKVDVYSFGVLLLEIICCRKNVDMQIGNEEEEILTDWAYDCYRAGRLDILVDNNDEAINDTKRLERFVMVAIWCLQEDPSVRPTMKKVMFMLEGSADVAIPPSPYPYGSVKSR